MAHNRLSFVVSKGCADDHVHFVILTLRALTTIYVDAGETVTFAAQEATELLHFGLPKLAGLRMPSHEQVHVEAAE